MSVTPPLDGDTMRRKEAERPLKEGGCAFFSSGRTSVQANPEAASMATCSALPFQTLTTGATVALTMPVSGNALQLFGIDSKQFDDLPDKTQDFMSGLRLGEVDTLDDGIRVDLWMLSDWSSLSRYHRGQNSD